MERLEGGTKYATELLATKDLTFAGAVVALGKGKSVRRVAWRDSQRIFDVDGRVKCHGFLYGYNAMHQPGRWRPEMVDLCGEDWEVYGG